MCHFWRMTPAELDALTDDQLAAFREFMAMSGRQ